MKKDCEDLFGRLFTVQTTFVCKTSKGSFPMVVNDDFVFKGGRWYAGLTFPIEVQGELTELEAECIVLNLNEAGEITGTIEDASPFSWEIKMTRTPLDDDELYIAEYYGIPHNEDNACLD